MRAASIDPRLSRADVGVLGALLEHVDSDSGEAHPGLERIAVLASVVRSTATRSLRRLESCGYFNRERSKGGPSSRTTVYRLSSCEAAPPSCCEPAPASRCELEPVAGANSHLTGGANSHHEPALKATCFEKQPSNASLASLALSPDEPPSRFEEFWKAYPRQAGSKAKARKAWAKRKLDRIAEQIIANVRERALHDRQWRDEQFIPYPTTYLNQERWGEKWQRAGKPAGIYSPTEAEAEQANRDALAKLGVAA